MQHFLCSIAMTFDVRHIVMLFTIHYIVKMSIARPLSDHLLFVILR